MSDNAPVTHPVDAEGDDFWLPVSLEALMAGATPWELDDESADFSDDEWAAFTAAIRG